MIRAKKGDLALSVNAIVIVVISFVVLGLALTLTRTIFRFAGERAESVIPLTELEAKPTPENPITISDTVAIIKGGTLTLSVGYYNKNDYPAEQAKFTIVECQNEISRTLDKGDEQPVIISPVQKVPQSEARGFKLILSAKDRPKLQSGQYICTVAVHKGTLDIQDIKDKLPNAGKNDNPVYDSKQFFLKVTA